MSSSSSSRSVSVADGVTFVPAVDRPRHRRPPRRRTAPVIVRTVERPQPEADPGIAAEIEDAAVAEQALAAFLNPSPTSRADGRQQLLRTRWIEEHELVESLLSGGADAMAVFAATQGLVPAYVVGEILREEWWFSRRDVVIAAKAAGLSEVQALKAAGCNVGKQ